MFGGHVARDAASVCEFPNRIAALEEHLNDPKAVRVGQRLEAFRRLLQCAEVGEGRQLLGFRLGGHRVPPSTQIYRNITTCQSIFSPFLRNCRSEAVYNANLDVPAPGEWRLGIRSLMVLVGS